MNSVPPPCKPETAAVVSPFSKTKYLRISFISAIISDASLLKPWFVKSTNHFLKICWRFLKSSNHFSKIWWKGFSKQIVMIFLIFCLLLQIKKMESVVSTSSLQMVSGVIIILWCALILLTIYNRKNMYVSLS